MTMYENLEVCRSLFDTVAYSLENNIHVKDYRPLAVLAEEGRRKVDAIIATVTDDCILRRPDYMELTDVPTAATGKVISLMTALRSTLDKGQREILSQIEAETVMEQIQSQNGLARRLCSCGSCRSLTA